MSLYLWNYVPGSCFLLLGLCLLTDGRVRSEMTDGRGEKSGWSRFDPKKANPGKSKVVRSRGEWGSYVAGGSELWGWPSQQLWVSVQIQPTALWMSCSASEIHAWNAIFKNLSDIISMYLYTYITFWCPCRIRKTRRSCSRHEMQPTPWGSHPAAGMESMRAEQGETVREQETANMLHELKGGIALNWTDVFCNRCPLKWLNFLPMYPRTELLLIFTNFKYWCNIFAASSKKVLLWTVIHFSPQAIKITACDLYKYKQPSEWRTWLTRYVWKLV